MSSLSRSVLPSLAENRPARDQLGLLKRAMLLDTCCNVVQPSTIERLMTIGFAV